jgi:hypothetical protein
MVTIDISVTTGKIIMTGFGLDDRGSISARERSFFSSLSYPDRLWNPLSLLSNGIRGTVFPEVKWPGLEFDHPRPSTTEWVELYLYCPLRLHGVVLQHRNNFKVSYFTGVYMFRLYKLLKLSENSVAHQCTTFVKNLFFISLYVCNPITKM